MKKTGAYTYVHPLAINIEKNVISLKRQYDVRLGPTVNLYLSQLVKSYDANIRPTVDPLLNQASNALSPYMISAKEQSILAYRVLEKHWINYTRQLMAYLQKNVFTGSLSFDNIQVVLSDSFEKILNGYADAYYWASNKISALIK